MSVRENLKAAIEEPAPMVWFSRNPEWEYSVKTKIAKHYFRMESEIYGEGLVRFVVPASRAKLRRSDYLAANPIPGFLRDMFAAAGNPAEWLATDEPVPLDDVRVVEVYYRGKWVPVTDVDDAEFEAYLAERPQVYAEASRSLQAKMEPHGGGAFLDHYVMTAATGRDVPLPFPLDEAERITFVDMITCMRQETGFRKAALSRSEADKALTERVLAIGSAARARLKSRGATARP
jgi:hypothetical protein